MASQSSTIVKRHALVTCPTPLEAQAEYIAADQEKWEVADDLATEQEVRERGPINDSHEDWAAFELEIEFYSHNLQGLLPE